LIEWITENETGTKSFEVERSNDGIGFSKMGGKPSKNLKSKTSYNYLDEHAFSINYYRLKMIDEDGNYSYSKVIVVNQNGTFYSAVQPNPFIQSFVVHTYLPSPQPIKIQLLDVNGRLLRYKSIMGIAGNNKIEFDDVGNLQPGIYMVRIVRGNSIIEKKIVKGNQ
jgi:trimeric autotransporter adhesin